MTVEVEFLPDLESLHLLLLRENMAHSPEIWLNIHQLLANRAAQGLLPKTAEEFARILGPLVCKNPRQQFRIPAVMQEWLNGQQAIVQGQISSSEHAVTLAWHKRIKRFNRRSRYGVAALVGLLLALAVVFFYRSPEPEPSPVPVQNSIKAVAAKNANAPIQSKVQVTNRVAPNPFPMPKEIPDNWQHRQKLLGQAIVFLPLIIALLWLIWHYRKRTVLRNKAPQAEKLLTRLTFNFSQDNVITPFGSSEFVKSAGKLLHPDWINSRRLHIADSVTATAQNFGYFTPRYQQRHIRPEYLILVQSVHGNDLFADYAELLVKALQQQKIDVRSYRFRDDPRRLMPVIQPLHGADTQSLTLEKLAQKRADARLIVMSDWNILFDPYYPDNYHNWVKTFENWQKRLWLSPGYKDEHWEKHAAQQAQQLNFRLLPLGSESIHEMVQWLKLETEQPVPLGKVGKGDDYLPAILTESEDSWLDWQVPYGVDLKRLCQELQSFLGQDGFLLLQALAVFPKPLSPLPQILDIQLFALSEPAVYGAKSLLCSRSEHRLQRICRLPWMRFSHMPDYLRICLLKSLEHAERKKIRLVWATILQALTDQEHPDKISVPISLPKTGKLKIRHLLEAQERKSAINDPIFANILLGGKLGLLDFTLPRALSRIFAKGDKWLDVRPVLSVMVLAAAGMWGANQLWQLQGRQWLLEHWQQQIEQQNALWQVQFSYPLETEQLAKALETTLKDKKFPVDAWLDVLAEPWQDNNQIRYAPGGKTQAAQVAQVLSWLSYGAPVEQIEDNTLSDYTLQVQLQQPHGVSFQESASFTSENINLHRKSFEPELVLLPAGSFMMGSTVAEKNSSYEERPQHEVTFALPFAIGKYEVTFAEYDAFAKVTGRSLPDDNGWGRGQRPVINVSFADAQAYMDWLSEQTGKIYRLPSEAEWEYAARAGSKTPYHWGKNINCSKANYGSFGNYCKTDKTLPVGSYPANPWGLYDMAGNVSEWTMDCWHNDYQFSPNDGFAWLREQDGDCGSRVVRSGAWNNIPYMVRSASRIRYDASDTNYNLGFRVARTL